MKQKLLSLSVLTTLIVGCSTFTEFKEEVSRGEAVHNPERIAFLSKVDKVKGKSNDYVLTDIHKGVNVVGVKSDGQYISGFSDPSGGNVAYKWNESAIPAATWEWQDGSFGLEKIWPQVADQYPLVFFAAYPKTDELSATQTTPLTKYVSPTNIPSANTHYNLSPASGPYVVERDKVTEDILAAVVTVPSRPVSGLAELTFKQILSLVDFNLTTLKNYKVFIQSVKIANINGNGRVYDYKTATWSAEPVYTAVNNASFCHSYVPSSEAAAKAITGLSETTSIRIDPLSDGSGGFNTLKLMPQQEVAVWNHAQFSADVSQWKSATAGLSEAAAIEAWYNNAVGGAPSGMKDSEGWKGARIELIYRVEDPQGRSVIGHKVGDVKGSGPATWTSDAYVRVGFPLNLNSMVNGARGWHPGYRYIYELKIATTDATNGVALDPDYKTADGANTTDMLDNPVTLPGTNITTGGTVGFDVRVDEWIEDDKIIM